MFFTITEQWYAYKWYSKYVETSIYIIVHFVQSVIYLVDPAKEAHLGHRLSHASVSSRQRNCE